MYITEIALYSGRKLSNKAEDLPDLQKISYGIVTDDKMQIYQEVVMKILHDDDEVAKLYDISGKAQKKFLKTRMSASKASVKESKNFEFNRTHPLFTPDSNLINLERIKAYKPQVSYLQWKKNKDPNSEDAKSFSRIVNRFKRNEKTEVKKIEEVVIEEDENLTENEKKKLSQLKFTPKKAIKTEFKDPNFYIATKPNPKGCSLFGKDGKINQEEITSFYVKDPEEEAATQGQFQWDKKKKKFTKSNGASQERVGKFKELDKKDFAKNKYQKWKKTNSIGFQKEGELESSKTTNIAKRLFTNRTRMTGYKNKTRDSSYSGPRTPKAQSELRNFDQILKGKKTDFKKKIKNAPKGLRGKIKKVRRK